MRELGRPAGSWFDRALGRAVDATGSTRLADVVDRLGLVPREVELREHPDTPALGINIGTSPTVEEAVAMGRRFLDEAAAHGRPRDGIWVWYTRPSGEPGRIFVERGRVECDPLWGATLTPDQVNSADFATSPSEAAAAIVGGTWEAAGEVAGFTVKSENKEHHMQDEKLADRLLREEREAKLDRERDAERSADYQGDFASGGEVPPARTGINVRRPTKGKVHIIGDGTSRGTTVALQVPRVDDDGFDEIPITNVTWVNLSQGLQGPGFATITTAAMDLPVDVVLDAEIGPKEITEIRVMLKTEETDYKESLKFDGLADQDGEQITHFNSIDVDEDEAGEFYLRIPIKPWPGEPPTVGTVKVRVDIDDDGDLERLRTTIEGMPARDKLEDEFSAAVKLGADMRVAVAAALPVVRELLEHHSLSPSGMQAIGELERMAVGANPEYTASMAAARARIASLEEQVDDQRAALHQQAARLSAHEDSSRVLLRHLAGRDPAWWVEAGEALKRLHDLTHPAMMAGANTDNSAEKERP